jgi:two-component system NtrC family sensor kinase
MKLLYSTRSKLILSYLGVSILVGIVSLIAGIQLLYKTVLNEAKTRISLDLNAAREIYLSHINTIYTALSTAKYDGNLLTYLSSNQTDEAVQKLRVISQQIGLDFAGIAMSNGKMFCRIGSAVTPGENQDVQNPIINDVFKNRTAVSGTAVLKRDFLLSEDPALADIATIEIMPTPMAAPRAESVENSGIALVSGVPLYKNDEFVGVIYGGILLNRSSEIVDMIRETVFQNETFKGRNTGTATIFYKDLRISTNVITPGGERAIGTRVSKEVRDRVLIDGERWTDRAFVVSDWYITAYEPILDITGERVGILYVGVLEEKYVDVRRNVLSVFIFITISGMCVAAGVGYVTANKVTKPIRRLIKVSNEVADGNLNPDLGPVPNNETGVLQRTFSEMLSALRDRDIRQKTESENKLLLSEKLSSVGRLAAGVAHEINNPLTGVLTFTCMLLRRDDLIDEVRSDLKTIAQQTERVRKIVKGLLDFSRQSKLEPEPVDINRLVESTIGLVKNEALINGINLAFFPEDGLPIRTIDRNQLQSTLLNILINAFDATGHGGNVTVTTGLSNNSDQAGQKGFEIAVSDSGCGIPPENLNKLFDPFFTTKEVGNGTGLGLAVSYGIIERHGGTIRVQSEVGKGSTFTVWLPLED